MANRTYNDSLANNELVVGTAGAGQEQITGAEIAGANSATTQDSGWTFSTLKSWVQADATYMSKAVYDTGGDGRVDNAENLSDGANTTSAAQLRGHIDDATIHYVINDGSTLTTVAWSGSYINTQLTTISGNLSAHTGDATIHFVINDGAALANVAWSGSYLNTQLGSISGDLSAHTGDSSIHFVIDDGTATVSVAWSGSYINTQLGTKIGDAASDNTTYLRQNGAWVNEFQNTGSKESVTAALGSFAPDIADGNAIYTSATGAITITGVATAIPRTSFDWILSHNSQTVGWPASFKFPGGTAPDLSSGNTVMLGGFTRDTGTTWIITYVENYTL